MSLSPGVILASCATVALFAAITALYYWKPYAVLATTGTADDHAVELLRPRGVEPLRPRGPGEPIPFSEWK